jgi:hypothetical protein
MSVRRRDVLAAAVLVTLAVAAWLLLSGPFIDFRSSPVPSS